MFFNELLRGINKKTFKICVMIFSLICVFSALKTFKSDDLLSEYLHNYISTPVDEFILFNLNPSGNLMIILFPLIVSISYSDTYFEDVKSGFIKSICTRYTKKMYLTSKFIVNLIIAGITFTIPLILNILVLLLRHPNISENPVLGKLTIYPTALFSEVFYNNPWLYLMLWIFIYFIYAGAFASVALAASIFIHNKFVIVAVPFILFQVLGLLLELTNNFKYNPLNFLYVSVYQDIAIIIGIFLMIITFSLTLFFIGGTNCEIY